MLKAVKNDKELSGMKMAHVCRILHLILLYEKFFACIFTVAKVDFSEINDEA